MLKGEYILMNTNTSNSDPSGQVPNGTDPTGQVPTPGGQVPTGSSQNVSLDTLPQAVQDYIKELRDKDASARVELKKFQAAQKKQQEEAALAQQKQLEEQGQFKQLAEQHAARVQQLEPIEQDYTELAALIGQQIDDETKDWPKSVKAMDPGKDAPIKQRLAWRNSAHAVVIEMQQTQRGKEPGNGPGPKSAGSMTPQQEQAALHKAFQQKRGRLI